MLCATVSSFVYIDNTLEGALRNFYSDNPNTDHFTKHTTQMSEGFYVHEFYEVLVRSVNAPINQVFNLLPPDRERIFPTTEVAAASIRASVEQTQNFRFWALSMLDRLGFICDNPGLGYYRTRNDPPEFLSKACAAKIDHEGSFLLLQRTLHSLALMGFGYHVRQIFNHMVRLFLQRQSTQNVTIQSSFIPWSNRTLLPAILANPDQVCSNVKPINAETPPGTPMDTFEFGIEHRMQAVCCLHGIIAAPGTNVNAERVMRCRVQSDNNCQFSEPVKLLD